MKLQLMRTIKLVLALGVFVTMVLFCKAFGYSLVQPWRNDIALVVISFVLLGLLHSAALLLAVGKNPSENGKVCVRYWAVLAVIVGIRLLISLEQIDASTPPLLMVQSILEILLLILLFHVSLHLLLGLALRHFRRDNEKKPDQTFHAEKR